MTDIVKLLFDECVGAPIAEGFAEFLRSMYREPHEIKHIRDFQMMGVHDEEWVPKIAALGFMVITSDKSKDPKGKKLKLLCLKHKMTQVILGKSIHHLRSPDKINAIICVWDDLIEAAKAPRGSRFIMAKVPNGKPTLQQRMVSPEEIEKASRYLVSGPDESFELKSE